MLEAITPTFEYKPENKVVTVVLLGNFNPLMFQPQWFGMNDIISQSEVDAIISNNNSLIAPNITIFNTSQLQIQVQENRFSVAAIKESFSMVKDVVKKTFERLGAIPINAMGINMSAHFKMPSKSKYQEFGDRLSPKSYWATMLGDNVSGEDRKGGLVRMQMTNQTDDKGSSLNVSVERSVRLTPGIFINCNDHYQFDADTDAESAMQKLEEIFETSLQKSAEIQTSLFQGL